MAAQALDGLQGGKPLVFQMKKISLMPIKPKQGCFISFDLS
ncbi:hypothetical protein [Allofranklinella schreckenbergeri]|nr:hypothetical protein [Allofranklinella schreckenbergeri]